MLLKGYQVSAFLFLLMETPKRGKVVVRWDLCSGLTFFFLKAM